MLCDVAPIINEHLWVEYQRSHCYSSEYNNGKGKSLMDAHLIRWSDSNQKQKLALEWNHGQYHIATTKTLTNEEYNFVKE